MSVKEYFALYSADCMQCKHLSPQTGTQVYERCHVSKGNKQCPAAEVQFAVVGEALNYAKQVLKARDKRFARTEARLMRYVGQQSSAFKNQFYKLLENGGILD